MSKTKKTVEEITVKKGAEEKTKSASVGTEQAEKEKKSASKVAKKNKPAAKDDTDVVPEPVVSADLPMESKPVKKSVKKQEPAEQGSGHYKNIGTFSADIINEFTYNRRNPYEEQERTLAFLNKCAKNGEILVGTVNGLIADRDRLVWGVSVIFEPFPSVDHTGMAEVVIPEQLFLEHGVTFGKDYDFKSKEDQFRIRRRVLDGYQGAKIHFCVNDARKGDSLIDPGTKVIYAKGDRNAAMAKLRDKYFYHRNRKPDRTDKPITIRPGETVEAFVVSANRRYVTVCALGVETRIYLHDLTRDNVSSCLEYVSVGDVLPECRVMNIKVKDNKVDLRLTNLKIDIPPALHRMHEGSYYRGRVASFNPENRSYMIYLDNGVAAFIKEDRVFPKGRELSIDDIVSVFVEHVNDSAVVGSCYKS